jgi:uncharacterized protein
MAGHEFADISRQRVINGNDVGGHGTNLRNRAARPSAETADVTLTKQSLLARSRGITMRKMAATRDSATLDNAASALVERLRAALTAALGSGDRAAVAAVRSALAAIGNAEAVDPAAQRGPADLAMAPSEHFAGAKAGLRAGDVPRKRLTAAEVTQIVQAEIAERLSAAAEYDRLGHGSQAERLRREADVLAAVLGPSPMTAT